MEKILLKNHGYYASLFISIGNSACSYGSRFSFVNKNYKCRSRYSIVSLGIPFMDESEYVHSFDEILHLKNNSSNMREIIDDLVKVMRGRDMYYGIVLMSLDSGEVEAVTAGEYLLNKFKSSCIAENFFVITSHDLKKNISEPFEMFRKIRDSRFNEADGIIKLLIPDGISEKVRFNILERGITAFHASLAFENLINYKMSEFLGFYGRSDYEIPAIVLSLEETFALRQWFYKYGLTINGKEYNPSLLEMQLIILLNENISIPEIMNIQTSVINDEEFEGIIRSFPMYKDDSCQSTTMISMNLHGRLNVLQTKNK